MKYYYICLLHILPESLLGLLFEPGDEGNTFLRNVVLDGVPIPPTAPNSLIILLSTLNSVGTGSVINKPTSKIHPRIRYQQDIFKKFCLLGYNDV
jgi:hypothetical protein